MLDLHFWPTPNGKKVTILLEDCGSLQDRAVQHRPGDQFTGVPGINPNHRMPAMVDHEPPAAGRRSASSSPARS